jgi:hypothetical protein
MPTLKALKLFSLHNPYASTPRKLFLCVSRLNMGYGNAIKVTLLLDILLAIHIRPEVGAFLLIFYKIKRFFDGLFMKKPIFGCDSN